MRNKFKICTVVQGKTIDNFLNNLVKAQDTATMVELRADTIMDLKFEEIGILRKATEVPSIFTFRHNNEGGDFCGSIAKQKKTLQKAFDLKFDYVDVALGNPILTEIVRKEKKRLLLSWHDFEKTPPLSSLLHIFAQMSALNPAIIKIATMVNKPEDILNLTILLQKKIKIHSSLVIIGMGEKGKYTRLQFPMMGSHIAYVSMKGETTISPGMTTSEELINSLKSIRTL